jgi:peptidoglycan/LPS O-acetylase OafA/YrhL
MGSLRCAACDLAGGRKADIRRGREAGSGIAAKTTLHEASSFLQIERRILGCNIFMHRESIPSLDGLRAISIGMVILGHAYVPTSLWARMLFAHAGLGVRIFFVISGYLITRLLLEEVRRFGNVSLPLFYARRALRILPAFLLFVTALLVLNQLGVISLPPGNLLLVLTYTVNFTSRAVWYSAHLWSLSVEEQFYFLWPLAVRFLPSRGWTAVALITFFSNIGFGVFHRLFGARLFGLNPAMQSFAFPFVCGPIAIGCLLAIWEKPIRRVGRPLFVHPMWITLIPVIMIADKFSREPIGSAGLDLLLVLFVARCVFHPQDAVGRFLNLRPMRFIGKLSYSLYLWQQLFFHYSFIPMFPLNVLGTAGFANASYFLLEKPFLKLRSSLRRKDTAPRSVQCPS